MQTNIFFARSILLSLCVIFSIRADLPIGTSLAAKAVAIQADGKIVVAGFANICNIQQVLVVRYNSDGTLDTTFNGLGYTTESLGNVSALNALVIQPLDQKIVVTGYTDNVLLIQRYTNAGILDTTFDLDGKNTNATFGFQATGQAIALQSTSFIIGGQATVGNITQFVLTRYDSVGGIDTTFGTNGVTLTPIGNGATINGLGFQSSGQIIAAGTCILNGVPEFALARYTANGNLDMSFGTSGIAVTLISGSESSELSAVAIDTSDRIIVAGRVLISGATQCIVARYTSSGVLDATFGTNSGYTPIAITNKDVGNSIAIQSDNAIVVAGASDQEMLLARFTANGIPSGTTTTQAGTDSSGAYGLALQANDQAVVAGFADDTIAVARYNTNGTLDTGFGGNGTGITTQPAVSTTQAC